VKEAALCSVLTSHDPSADADAQLTPQQASALLSSYESEERTAVSRGRGEHYCQQLAFVSGWLGKL